MQQNGLTQNEREAPAAHLPAGASAVGGNDAASAPCIETERLVMRPLTRADKAALLGFMRKPEVMYAWEHGFTDDAVGEWIERQLARYRRDGMGYMAVVMKETGRLIGQAGLLKSRINGEEVTEIGYIFHNDYWHRGFATEAARACMAVAFGRLGQAAVWCSIRPENAASIRLAERLGMRPCGRHDVVYNRKIMPHLLFRAEQAKTP